MVPVRPVIQVGMAHAVTSPVRVVTMETVVVKYVRLARGEKPVIQSQESVLTVTPAELAPGMKTCSHISPNAAISVFYLSQSVSGLNVSFTWYVHIASLAIL